MEIEAAPALHVEVSILTPTYNHELYLEKCIQSVLEQSFEHWEMWIIDDGSTDATLSIALRYAQSDPRIQVIHGQKHGIDGLARTYNLGLERAQGKYIAILEGDDYWYANKLEKQWQAVQSHPEAVLCYSRALGVLGLQVVEQYPKQYQSKMHQSYENVPMGSIVPVLLYDFPTPCTYLISKEALLRAGAFYQVPPFPSVDLNTVLDLSDLGPFIYIDEPLAVWRQQPHQVTKSRGIELVEGASILYHRFLSTKPAGYFSSLGFDPEHIYKQLVKKKMIAYSRQGRFALIRGEFGDARRYYLQSIRCYPQSRLHSWLMRSVVGWVFAWCGWDVELLARILGKKSFSAP